MAAPYTASPSRSQSTKSQPAVTAPYIWGAGLTVLFIVQVVPGVSSFVGLRIMFMVVSLLMILVVPGVFLVGLAFPDTTMVSPLGFLGLTSVASLLVNLTVGYVLSSYRLLDAEWLFVGIGSITAVLILLTWWVRGQRFWVCRLKTKIPKEWTIGTKWPSLAMVLVTLAVFVAALLVSIQSDHIVYSSVYLANRQGDLSGYPVQLQLGQSRILVLHVDNQGAASEAYVMREVDNGRTIWSTRRVIGDNRAWSHLVRLPATDVGVNRVHVIVKRQGRLTANLHVTYRVRR